MARDDPRFEENDKKVREEINKSSEIYLYNLFAPESKKIKGGELAIFNAVLDQFSINAALSIASFGFAKVAPEIKPLFNRNSKKTLELVKDKIRKKSFEGLENITDEQINKLIKEAEKKSMEISGRMNRLLNAAEKGQVTKNEFLAECLNLGMEANQFFFDFNTAGVGKTANEARKYLMEAYENIGSISPKERDAIVSRWAKGALKADDVKSILAAGQDAFEPFFTYMHTTSTARQFEQVLDIPEVKGWLKSYNIDVNQLKKYSYDIAKNHDIGKMRIAPHYINSFKTYAPDDPAKFAIQPHEKEGEKLLHNFLNKEKNYDARTKAGFVDKEGIGDRPGISWSANDPFGLEKGEITFSSIARGHGKYEALNPVETLMQLVDEANAFGNPRTYKAPGDMSEFSTSFPMQRAREDATKPIDNKKGKNRYNVPDKVLDAFEKKYPEIFENTKTGFEPNLGELMKERSTRVFDLLDEDTADYLKNYKRYNKKPSNFPPPDKVYESGSLLAKDILKGAYNAAVNAPRQLGVQHRVYEDYRKAHPVKIADADKNPYAPAHEPATKSLRSAGDFGAGIAGLNMSSNVSDVANTADGDNGYSYLNRFYKRNLLKSKASEAQKKSVKNILDNWDDLSHDDKGYFLRDVPFRYKWLIESPEYDYDYF